MKRKLSSTLKSDFVRVPQSHVIEELPDAESQAGAEAEVAWLQEIQCCKIYVITLCQAVNLISVS